MNSCVAGLNVAVGRGGTISATLVYLGSAELPYESSELVLA